MKPGDKVRLKQDYESLRRARDIGFPQSETVYEIRDSYPHSNGPAWVMTTDWWCFESILEYAPPPKPPKPRKRAHRLHRAGMKYYGITPSVRPVPRLPELRALHGVPFIRLVISTGLPYWFKNLINYSGVNFDSQTKLITKANGQKMKATKWLQAIGGDETKTQELAVTLNDKTFDMVLSCSYKDLIRASVSRNFRSCWKEKDIYELLERPNIAIAGTKDKHGDYLSRWIVWWDSEHNRAILNPVPYPQKESYTTALALTDKCTIWVPNSRGMTSESQYWNYRSYDNTFRTKRLYDEMSDKASDTLYKLSLASSEVNNEDHA